MQGLCNTKTIFFIIEFYHFHSSYHYTIPIIFIVFIVTSLHRLIIVPFDHCTVVPFPSLLPSN